MPVEFLVQNPRKGEALVSPMPLFGGLALSVLASVAATTAVQRQMQATKRRNEGKQKFGTIARQMGAAGTPLDYDRRATSETAHYEPKEMHGLRNWLRDDNSAKAAVRADKGQVAIGRATDRPGIVAHELGHASIGQQPIYTPSRFNQSVLRPITSLVGMIVGPMAGNVIGAFQGLDEKNRYGGPLQAGLAAGGLGALAGGVINAPTLINEWQASHRAGNWMDTHGARAGMTPQEIEKNKKLLRRAWGTYAVASMAVPALVAGLRAGYIKSADAPRKDDKKKRPTDQPESALWGALPWVAGGSLAGALGLSKAREGIFPKGFVKELRMYADQATADRILERFSNVPEHRRNFEASIDYALQGNRLLSHQFPGGQRPLDLVMAQRKLMHQIPKSFSLEGIKEWWNRPAFDVANPGTNLHYSAFEKSPLVGFQRLFDEVGYGWDVKGRDKLMLSDTQRKEFTEALNRAIRKAGGPMDRFFDAAVNVPASKDAPATLFADTNLADKIPYHEQAKIMRKLPDLLKGDARLSKEFPDYTKVIDSMGAAVQGGARDAYASAVDNQALAINDALRSASGFLAGAGALGLGAYGVKKLFDFRRKYQEEKKRNQSMPAWAARQALSAVGLQKTAEAKLSVAENLLSVHPGLRRLLGVELPRLDINLGLDVTKPAIGALAGGAAGALSGFLDRPGAGATLAEREAASRRKKFLNPLTGAVIGGLAGTGLSAIDAIAANKMWEKIPPAQQQLLIQSGSKVRAGGRAAFN